MKRAFCLIAAALTLICAVACVSPGEGDAADASDTAAPARTEGVLRVIFHGDGEDTAGLDLSKWDRDAVSSHSDGSAPQSATVNVLGKEFTGKYDSSAIFYPASHLSHIYKTQYGSFAINAETGKLDAFTAGYEKTDETLSADDVAEKATEAAKRFIDIDEYRLEVTEADEAARRPNHVFRWTKYVGDLPTTDAFSIGISMYGGGISSIGCSLVGTFDATEENVAAVKRLAGEDAEAVLKAKVAERFEGVEYELWIGDYEAICLPDGTPALMTRVEVSRNEVDIADGETYYYPHTSAYDAFLFYGAAN